MRLGIAAVLFFICTPLPEEMNAAEQPVFVIRGPTIIAFFPLAAKKQIDTDTNGALADFQRYAFLVREPLRRSGIDFHEVYTPSFLIQQGKQTTTFSAGGEGAGYYLIAPGKKARVERGVMTDINLLKVAGEYFVVRSTASKVRSAASGKIKLVSCKGDRSFILTLVDGKQTIVFHADNYLKINFITVYWKPPDPFNPCRDINGKWARVEYKPVRGQPFAGEIISLDIEE